MRAGLLVLLCGCRQLLGFEDVRDQPADGAIDIALVDAGGCQTLGATCATADELDTCEQIGQPPVQQQCPWGCSTTNGAHCAELQPTGGAATADDLRDDQLADVVLPLGTMFDTGTGAILQGVRTAGAGVINGIGFEIKGGAAVFRFRSLQIDGTTTAVGANAIVLVATDEIIVAATVNANGACMAPSPGGGQGGNAETAGIGPGGGGGGSDGGGELSGGGGAGHLVVGADGGDSVDTTPGGDGGPAYGSPDVPQLSVAGGSGGGGGGGNNVGRGGSGGGAIQLLANRQIQILVTGGINAGGCGGGPGNSESAGGGGGSGGTIVLEAPSVTIAGGLAVNGGGGGGGQNGTAGANGLLSTSPALGGNAAGTGGRGGNGGTDTPPEPGELEVTAGGGGGAAGWIRINTRNPPALTGFTSPPLGAQNTGVAVTQ